MKFTKSDYDTLKKMMDTFIESITVKRVIEYRKLKLGDDIEKRFRWDLFWGARDLFLKDDVDGTKEKAFRLYKDDHIDTALNKYVTSRTDLNIN
jgi:hypothetical protein